MEESIILRGRIVDSTKGYGMPAVAGLMAIAFAVTMTAEAEFVLQDYSPLASQDHAESEQTQGQLVSIMQNAVAGAEERLGRNSPFLTADDIPALIRYVNENNNTEAAATARLFLAALILREGQFQDADEALPILRDIQHARPNTWQAAVGRVEEAAALAREVGSTSDKGSEDVREAYEALRCELVRVLPVAEAIDRDKRPTVELFRTWYVRPEESMRIATLGALATVSELLGDTDDARDYLHRIQEAAPGTSSARSAEARIERIDRGEPLETSLPTGREEPTEELTPAERREKRDEVLRKELESELSGKEDSVVEGEKTDVAEEEASRRQDAPNASDSSDEAEELPTATRTVAGVGVVVGAVCLLWFGAKKLWHRE